MIVNLFTFIHSFTLNSGSKYCWVGTLDPHQKKYVFFIVCVWNYEELIVLPVTAKC